VLCSRDWQRTQFVPLDRFATASFGLILGALAHAIGWPIARRGSQSITNALARYLMNLGGEIVTDKRIDSLNQLPSTKAILCDLTPRQIVRVAGASLPAGYRRKLERYRYGPAAFKLDWALSSPVPWTAPGCYEAATYISAALLQRS
jgi:phytoene dehydrogenase-like protein